MFPTVPGTRFSSRLTTIVRVIGFLKNPQSDTHVPCNLTISSWNEPLISTWKGGDAAGKFNVNEKWRLSVDVIASFGSVEGTQ